MIQQITTTFVRRQVTAFVNDSRGGYIIHGSPIQTDVETRLLAMQHRLRVLRAGAITRMGHGPRD
jgi:hypothetical protein